MSSNLSWAQIYSLIEEKKGMSLTEEKEDIVNLVSFIFCFLSIQETNLGASLKETPFNESILRGKESKKIEQENDGKNEPFDDYKRQRRL